MNSRQQLLNNAIGYYAEHGVRDTSLRTLAAAIGTSQRMLNYHFGSREDLLAAVIATVVQSDIENLASLFERHPDPIEAGRANWQRATTQAAHFGPLFFELASHTMHGAVYAKPLGDAIAQQAEGGFAQAYRTRTDPRSAQNLARLTVAVGRGLLFQLLIDGDQRAADAAIEEFIALVARHLEDR